MTTEIELNSVAGEKSPHPRRKESLTQSQKQMEVVGHECPGEAFGAGLYEQFGESGNKTAAITVIAEDIAAFNATYDNVLQKIRGI
ncbi:MAG: hypothetical protein WCG31_06435 [Deltaproteobacteria bacterium]